MSIRYGVYIATVIAAMVLAGCGGRPQPEKVVVKKETPKKSAPAAPSDAGNLGASHQQESAQEQKKEMAKVEQPAGSDSSSEKADTATAEAPGIEPKEGFRIDQAVDNMGRGTLHFLVPEEWKSSQPSSSMRIAQYSIPGEAGEAELAIFGPMGGSVQMNIDRWIGQVEQPDGSSSKDKAIQEKMKGDEFEFTFLDVTGTYKGMQMPGMAGNKPQENYRLMASIVETPSGPWFFKATGPHDTLEKWVEDFKTMCASIRMQGGGAHAAPPPAAPAGSGSSQ